MTGINFVKKIYLRPLFIYLFTGLFIITGCSNKTPQDFFDFRLLADFFELSENDTSVLKAAMQKQGKGLITQSGYAYGKLHIILFRAFSSGTGTKQLYLWQAKTLL